VVFENEAVCTVNRGAEDLFNQIGLFDRYNPPVVPVEETDLVEEVFCATVDGTHSFVPSTVAQKTSSTKSDSSTDTIRQLYLLLPWPLEENLSRCLSSTKNSSESVSRMKDT